jgi:hypothetical protein
VKREGQVELHIEPISWKQACQFVANLHRHHKPARGQKWAIAACDKGRVVHGVGQCGRPVARAYDDGLTCEVNRTCTDGSQNVNSCVYGACWRIAREMGYHTSITYTQEGESGVSLKACGYRFVKEIEPRPGWAASSVKLRALRDPVGTGDVGRTLWAISVLDWKAVLKRFGVKEEKAA